MKKLYFGTDGIRGAANDELTSTHAYRLGAALSTLIRNKRGLVIVGRDTRLSSPMLSSSLIGGLLSRGVDVYDLGVFPTPGIAYSAIYYHADFAVVISASHNPFSDNGLKVISGKGTKISDNEERALEKLMELEEPGVLATDANIGRLETQKTLREPYYEWLLKHHFVLDKTLAPVYIDTANGAMSEVAPSVFKRLGIPFEVINNQPDGLNINRNCGSLHPQGLLEGLKSGKYAYGLSYDGDGDRFLAFNNDGQEFDGDRLIFLYALYLKEKNKLQANQIVTTSMANLGFLKALKKNEISYQCVDVGDKNVQAALSRDHLSLGGESSGHIIIEDELPTGDGLLSSLFFMRIANERPDLIKEALAYKKYPALLLNFPFINRDALNAYVNSKKYIELVTELENRLCGIGRVFVRASGTEPLLRILLEAEDEKALQATKDFLEHELEVGGVC